MTSPTRTKEDAARFLIETLNKQSAIPNERISETLFGYENKMNAQLPEGLRVETDWIGFENKSRIFINDTQVLCLGQPETYGTDTRVDAEMVHSFKETPLCEDGSLSLKILRKKPGAVVFALMDHDASIAVFEFYKKEPESDDFRLSGFHSDLKDELHEALVLAFCRYCETHLCKAFPSIGGVPADSPIRVVSGIPDPRLMKVLAKADMAVRAENRVAYEAKDEKRPEPQEVLDDYFSDPC